ncbi:uncharacterized protein LOC118798409 [Colossoma macropomum]|uniref:uncharacterized protein LOC118798409 n=1 Tax=Colossoma macropomum TaxID=42526 RepID=UPI001863B229|nr:uncharacterized protein LOC118798409 [Colossoma macropomum]XP_036413741.1 uncharacterized protein LOC118798409 [Colossoma macropomum]
MQILGLAVILASVLKACLNTSTPYKPHVQIGEVQVQIGGTVILPCNSSAYSRGELDVHWEAMGKDVAFFQNGHLLAGQGYEGRVELQLSKALEGDFSLTLTNAVMSDTDLYECLWQGKRSISTVILNVLPPPFSELHTSVTEGEDVTLPCYGRIPKNKPWEKMFVQWLKDEKEVLLFSSGKITTNTGYRGLALPPQEEISWGIYSLTIESVRASDQGIYKCRYKANDYEAPRSGVPETYSLSVLEPDATVEEASDVTEMTSFSTSTELTGLIVGASEDNNTVQDTTRVIPELLPQLNTTTDTTVLIADAATQQDTMEVIPELLPQPNTTTDTTVLIADASADSTTVQDTVGGVLQMQPQPSTTSDLFGLLAKSSADSTTRQDTMEVIPELLPQPNTTTDTTVLIADASADSTTVQDTVGGVLQMQPQPSTTSDLFGLLAKSSAESGTGQDTMEVIPELPWQPSTTADFNKLIADSSGESTTVQDAVGGDEDPFEYLWAEKVPWVRIGMISVVLLVTAAFLGTLVALGKL